MTSDNMTGRVLSAYANEEPWRRAHNDAMACNEIERTLSLGIHLFRSLMQIESFVIANGRKLERPALERELADCTERLRAWITPSRRYAEIASNLASKGYEVNGLDEFRIALEEAVCVAENCELEAFVPPMADLMRSANRSNPDSERYGDY